MYDLDTPQEQDSFRDAYELGLTEWPPTDERELARLDEWAEERQREMALELGYDPFGGESIDEFFESFSARCGSQFAEEIPA